jgi:hypothetical protein
MSVLSNPQGTPERVWSLVAGLAAMGKSASRGTYDGLLNPGYLKEGIENRAKDSLAANAHGAALSLELVEAGRDKAHLLIEPPSDFSAFADHVHDHLAALSTGDPDAPILETYAWIAADSDRSGGTHWIYQCGREEFADRANSALVGEGEDGKPMNTTKLVPCRRWLAFLGLGIPLPLEGVPDLPSPIERISRELDRGNLASGSVMDADDFVTWLAGRMPYLDRGRLYIQACQRIGHVPAATRLSPLLSSALRELHDEGVIQLILSGDAAERVRLAEESTHAFDAFSAVTILPRAAS